MPAIQEIRAQEILDSRGQPTVMAGLTLDNGLCAQAMVPSGASTGENEALELRDGGQRYLGKGVLQAVKNIHEVIAPKLKGLNPLQQVAIDRLMCDLDGTATKSRLGANAILAVSMAVARAGAAVRACPFTVIWAAPARHAAHAHAEHHQRRGPRRQQPGYPGVHDYAGGRGQLRRSLADGGRVFQTLKKVLSSRAGHRGGRRRRLRPGPAFPRRRPGPYRGRHRAGRL